MDYDLCVIGAGWAGFNAALGAARLGKKVCLIEDKQIGGTCLNRGCIPTKTFVRCSQLGMPLPEIQRKKDEIIMRLQQGIEFLLKTHKVDYVAGRGRIESPDCVCVNSATKFKTRFVLLATGSTPRDFPNLKIDHQRIISSDDVQDLRHIPKRILIVGGGVIGCEFACIFNRLGSDASIAEITDQLVPGFDPQVAKKLQQAFQKAGITVHLGHGFEKFNLDEYDQVLLAVGRQGVIQDICSPAVNLRIERGFIGVDEELRTSVSSLFAAGDCIGGYMLAHVASYEGELAVNNMFCAPKARDYSAVPTSVFTLPEIASIGLTEEQAKKSHLEYKASTTHYLSVGMAHIKEDTQGFVKVVAEVPGGRILGASIMGLEATELINTFAVAIKGRMTVADLKNTIFAHPSISEILGEAAKAFS